ncbi:hypothetical protein [Streptomyces sp. NPDC059861]|uniref:hypothetical protein n=1 Tax=Streptomyces sp. NPDC059861 TaxID=3346974 RepID=UPI00365D7F82
MQGQQRSGDGRRGSRFVALLGAVMRDGELDAEAERQALAAFRAARDAGAHRARTRGRDVWRARSAER